MMKLALSLAVNMCAGAGIAAGAFIAPAHAQDVAAPEGHRLFPANALRGEMAFGQPPEVLINGQPALLAPGARIRGADNLLVMSGTLAGLKSWVHYTRELGTGLVMNVWVLNDVERANKRWPRTEEEAQQWLFDPAAQTWSKP